MRLFNHPAIIQDTQQIQKSKTGTGIRASQAKPAHTLSGCLNGRSNGAWKPIGTPGLYGVKNSADYNRKRQIAGFHARQLIQ